MTYAQQRALAIGVAVLLGGWAVVQAGGPDDFGLTPIAARWIGVVMAMLGILAGFLPSVQGRGRDPSFLADRVVELPAHDRASVLSDVRQRTGMASPITRPPLHVVLHDSADGHVAFLTAAAPTPGAEMAASQAFHVSDHTPFADASVYRCDSCDRVLAHVAVIDGEWVATGPEGAP